MGQSYVGIKADLSNHNLFYLIELNLVAGADADFLETFQSIHLFPMRLERFLKCTTAICRLHACSFARLADR
jgi:hypothetical protein